ncbi:MAG: hypothetical protein GY793_01900 [Proteobacteria bacterium]|nr:hypothetical protein [Pseudomonadota bacterium]
MLKKDLAKKYVELKLELMTITDGKTFEEHDYTRWFKIAFKMNKPLLEIQIPHLKRHLKEAKKNLEKYNEKYKVIVEQEEKAVEKVVIEEEVVYLKGVRFVLSTDKGYYCGESKEEYKGYYVSSGFGNGFHNYNHDTHKKMTFTDDIEKAYMIMPVEIGGLTSKVVYAIKDGYEKFEWFKFELKIERR